MITSSRSKRHGFRRLGALNVALIAGVGLFAFLANNRPADDEIDRLITGSIATPELHGAALSDVPVPKARPEIEIDRGPYLAPEARSFITYDNRDMFGGDYNTIKNTSLAECEARCGADDRCRAYTFNKWQNFCFLKSKIGAIRLEPQGTTAIAASEDVKHARQTAFIQKSPARRFSGSPYKTFHAAGFSACANECLGDAECLGVNFVRAERSCSLMRSLDKPTVANATDVGIKLQRGAPTPRKTAHAPPRRPPSVHPLFDAVLKELARY